MSDVRKEIENLGDWAEDRFALFCSQAGVVANKANKDRTGWDFLLEFAQQGSPIAPPDHHKPEITARVQVKSNEQGKKSAVLKLDNARRFAASPDPCFLVLAAATDGAEPVRFYAKHFWTPEIERTLKRLRQSETRDKPVHKQTLTISFSEDDDHTEDLIEWMRGVVRAGHPDYASRKRLLNENLGYEDGRYFGTITFQQTDLQKFVDHSIGLDAKIDLANARMVDRRFGIDAKTPVFDIKPDRVEMRTHPKPCTIEITDSEDQVHQFEGEIFTPGIPGLPLEMAKARVIAGPLEAVFEGTGYAKFNYQFSSSDEHELPYLISCVRLLAAIGRGALQVSAIINGERIDSGRVETEEVEGGDLFRDLTTLLIPLAKISQQAGTLNIKLSLDSVLEAWDQLLEFRNHFDSETMDFVLEKRDGKIVDAEISRLVTGLTLALEQYRFTVVLAHRLKSDEIEDGNRKLTFLKPTVLRSIVDQRDEAAHGAEVQEELKRYAKRHGEGVITIHRTENGSGFAISMVNPEN